MSNVTQTETATKRVLYPLRFYRPFRAQHLYSTFPKYDLLRATIDCVTVNKTKNALRNETVILNYIDGEPISHSLSNLPFVNVPYVCMFVCIEVTLRGIAH